MNKRNRRFLSLFVSAICAGYTLGAANIGYAEEVSEIKVENSAILSDEELINKTDNSSLEEQELYNIINGTATLEDYEAIGMTELDECCYGYVDENNFEGISLLLKGNTNITDLETLRDKIYEITYAIQICQECNNMYIENIYKRFCKVIEIIYI